MKGQKIILSFVPWIVFSTSIGYSSFLSGAVIALILNIVIARDALLRGVVLEIGGTIFFASMVILGFFLHHGDIFTQYPNFWSNAAMTIIMLGSVMINKPFTGQYSNRGSHRLHKHLSIIWGMLLLSATLISLAHIYFGLSNTMSTVGTVIVILIGIKANKYYPKWFYRKNKIDLSKLKVGESDELKA